MKDPGLIRFSQEGLRFAQVPVQDGYFTSAGARLHYSVFGTGEPVVLVHGGMGNSTNWANQIGPILASGRRAIVADTRGHGRSTSGSQDFSYRLLAEDLLALLDHIGLENAGFVGWSDGACSSLELARTSPHRVIGVIFFACNVDPTGTREFVMTPTIGHCVKRHELDFEAMTPGLESFAELQPRLEPMQKNEPNYRHQDLASIDRPIVVIQGRNDEFIKLEHAAYLSESLPNSRFEVIEGSGHFAPIEDPDAFNAVMMRSLEQLSTGRPSSRDAGGPPGGEKSPTEPR